jgi:hypothetical protein
LALLAYWMELGAIGEKVYRAGRLGNPRTTLARVSGGVML